MRKILLVVFSFITIYTSASEPIKMGVITDIHYLSKDLMDNGYMMQNYVYNTGKDVIVVPEVLDKVLSDYLNSDIEVLLICGDITKDGEKQSHLDFVNLLKPLEDKGIKIFVIPGNHDINIPNATKYQGNKTFKTDNISSKEFDEIYANYGFKDALFTNKSSLSYVAELSNDTWLLAIDAALYNSNSSKPISGGVISDDTEMWIDFVLSMAQKMNKQVVAMMHWGVVEHLPLQASLFSDYLVYDHTRVANLLADNNINIIFTGHFHSNDISQFTSARGNTIYDIETGSLVSYPFSYRFVDLYKDKAIVKTKNIRSIDSKPDFVQKNKAILKRIAQQRAQTMLASKRLKFSDEHLKQIADIAGELFLVHLYGDEKVEESIKGRLVNIFQEMNFPVDENLNNLNLDFPPADNNITIHF